MALDAWLPIGFKLPDGAKARVALFEGADWQILESSRATLPSWLARAMGEEAVQG